MSTFASKMSPFTIFKLTIRALHLSALPLKRLNRLNNVEVTLDGEIEISSIWDCVKLGGFKKALISD